ncbi:MAG TPA: ABC transporter substrate binding protein [Stellaceae bacterium]|nr:ABC transporter substrate binding protein [Stellaceae bacterium]
MPRAHQDSRQGFDGILSMLRREVITVLGGSMVAWPLAARAQAPMPVIGYLGIGSPESDAFRVTAFRQRLSETGYVEGQNVSIEYRWAHGQNDRLPALAGDLVHLRVLAIVAAGAPPAFAAKAATSAIPTVFVLGIDPVQPGIVASLNRPGGNMTGVALLAAELAAKRLQLLHELLPAAAVVAVLVDPSNPTSGPPNEKSAGRSTFSGAAGACPASQHRERDRRRIWGPCRAPGRRARPRQRSVLHQPACSNRRSGGPPRGARDLRDALVRRGRRADELRRRLCR